MQKAQIREFLNDLKISTRFGQAESVEAALDDLRSLPGVAANQRLSEGFLSQLVKPAGKLLAKLPLGQLQPLLDDRLAALRAIGGVALAEQYLTGKDISPKLLLVPARDTRPEVRTALGETLREGGEAYPERLLPLMQSWLTAPFTGVRETALLFVPVLASTYEGEVFSKLKTFIDEEHPEVRATLVTTLQTLAQRGSAEFVLELLAHWVTEPRPNVWVIGRTLSGSWAVSHPVEVKSILHTLQAKVGERKSITNALKALARHGLIIEIS